MPQKILTGLILTLMAATPIFAQSAPSDHGDIPQAVIETFALEPPISQADVDAYIKIIPELPKLMNDPQSAETIAAAHNLSPVRFSYIMAKVPLTMAIAAGADPKTLGLEALPKVLHPTAPELAVVRTNLEALSATAAEAYKALAETAPGATAK
ncbi:MAG: hypothetical protein LBV21_05010 [Candidatus Adiutrix sp.]|jgi:hypothetical protein|nr:hypothetical protein [Candidatus Adiutrix sp.]